MDDYKVKKFLRYYWRDIVEFALDLANLSDHEREAVDLIGIRGLTIEYASERCDVSVKTMQSRYSRARKRLSRAWAGIKWIEVLADTMEE